MGASSVYPRLLTITPSLPCWTELMNTFCTLVASPAMLSTKNTRSPPADSLNAPGAMRAASSRASTRALKRSAWLLAQGDTIRLSSATINTNGAAKPNTGRAQAVKGIPLTNQTTISESRYWRETTSSTDMNTVSDNSTGR